MGQLPRWYVPKNKPTPDHLVGLPAARSVDGVGPDGPGGGLTIGGTFQAGEPGWVPVAGGAWFINLTDVQPQTLVRLDLSRRILRWLVVAGTVPGHWWQVPVLLSPELDASGQAVIYRSALDQSFDGKAWHDPADLAPLQNRLLLVALNVASGGEVETTGDLANLVGELLVLGHRLTIAELFASGWLTTALLVRTLIAAADVPMPEAAHG